MVTGLWWCVAAQAAPGSAGALHLGALPFEAGSAYAGFGIGGGYVAFIPGVAPIVEGGVALGDRFALTGTLGVELGAQVEAPLLVQGRWLAVDQDVARVAVTLSQGVVPPVPSVDRPLELHTFPGIAVDVGGPRVRFDAAVPLWGVSSFGTAFGVERFPMPALATAGVDVSVGDDPGRHRLRFGWPEIASYHYRHDGLYFDVGGGFVLVAATAFVKVGALF